MTLSVPRLGSPSRSASLALSNLRGVVILIVLAFHSVLAYLQWNPVKPTGFNSPPYDWRSFPIIDDAHFFGFDLFCAWQDVYLMSLMFFLSGLFVWSSLTRRSDWGFLRDRLLRLGLPYAFGLVVLMPIATYPTYLLTALDPSVGAYWRAWLALPFWTDGPLWFLWQLLALNVLVAALRYAAPRLLPSLGRWSSAAEQRPSRYFAILLGASALAYVPLALAFSPWRWTESGLFNVQLCRPLHYAVYFFAGVGIGVGGVERGLLRADGILPRHWRLWLAAALGAVLVWMGLTALTLDGNASIALQIADDLSFVVACMTGCFFVIAACLRFAAAHSRFLEGLSRSAYGLYLVHYDFVVWLQYALLGTTLFAIAKAALVFVGTLGFSWVVVRAVQRIPFGARLIGEPPRAIAAS